MGRLTRDEWIQRFYVSLSEELILVISAAIAAYLGKKAPIRGIRLLGSDAWSHQGRLTIQASHERVLSRPGR